MKHYPTIRFTGFVRRAAIAATLVAGLCHPVIACQYCSLLNPTFTSRIEDSQIAIVGTAQDDGKFRIQRILKGADVIDSSAELTIEGTSPSVPTLVLGQQIDESTFDWQRPQQIGRDDFVYIIGALEALSHDPIDLAYFFPFLGNPDVPIADDAFYQFAKSDFSVIYAAKESYDRDHILDLVHNQRTLPEHQILGFQLLGIVGTEQDSQLLLEQMEAAQAEARRGLEIIIASYLSLAGSPGIEHVTQKYLADPECKYELTHAAIKAIRQHLENDSQLDRQELLSALHAVLANAEIADVVLPDLIAANDWTAISQVAQLFRDAKERWIRVGAATYLVAAPGESTKDVLPELRAIDESAFVEAETGIAPPPVITTSAGDVASRTAIGAATSFLSSPVLATVVIAIVIALLVVASLRLLKKKPA
ncbi:MAG: hypothetical protein KDB27_08530 [Planctomycetales bacterium]|nr:hypothetical protein [Planctomycetales bacterium]